MRALLLRIAAVAVLAEAGVACGGESGPDPSVLTTLEVTPTDTTLFTVAPGNTVNLSVVAKDQHGEPMTDVGTPGFSSGDVAVATVSDDGTITAVGAGTTEISASLTAGGITETGTAAVTVQVAPASATVVAPEFTFQPSVVDVSPGGTVTWTFGAIRHTVSFSTEGAPEDIDLAEGSAERTFPNNGSYDYRCLLHSQMTGVVHVH